MRVDWTFYDDGPHSALGNFAFGVALLHFSARNGRLRYASKYVRLGLTLLKLRLSISDESLTYAIGKPSFVAWYNPARKIIEALTADSSPNSARPPPPDNI